MCCDGTASTAGKWQRLCEHMFFTTGMCRSGVVDNPLETLIRAIERFVRVPALELTPTELGDHLVRLRHGVDVLELGFATSATTFAATDEYDAQGSITPIDWIRHHCHMSGHAAARAVAAGAQVSRLPASVMALDAGDIGFAHFSLLAGVARAVSASSSAADPDDATSVSSAIFDEGSLLELARDHSVGRFGHDCTHARHVHDAAAVLEDHVTAAERNRCEFIPCEGGFMAMRGFFDPIAAATIKTAVLPLTRPSGAGDDRQLPAASPTRWSRSPATLLTSGPFPPRAVRALTSSSPPRSRR
jgi:hypothetical protein